MNDELIEFDGDLSIPNMHNAIGLYENLKPLIEEVDSAKDKVKKISEKGFLGRFMSNVTGETAKAYSESQNLQVKLQKYQIAIALINLKLVAKLNDQQKEIKAQQDELIRAKERIEKQQKEIVGNTERISEQQQTIFKLLYMTEEQEAQIREVVRTAGYVKNLEKKTEQSLIELSKDIKNGRKENEKMFSDQLELQRKEHSRILNELKEEFKLLVEESNKKVEKLSNTIESKVLEFYFTLSFIAIAIIMLFIFTF